jgi:hypothetical protein
MKKWISNIRNDVRGHFKGMGYLSYLSPLKGARNHNKSINDLDLRRGFVSIKRDSSLLQYLHHIPHLSEAYFNFFSLFLWSCELSFNGDIESKTDIDPLVFPTSSLNGEEAKGVVIVKLRIHESSKQFWTMKYDSASHIWIKDLTDIVDNALSEKTIECSSCHKAKTLRTNQIGEDNKIEGNSKYVEVGGSVTNWFLRPSDALILGSLILKEDPCKYRGASKKQLLLESSTVTQRRSIKLGILNRKNDRILENTKEIMQADLRQNRSFSISQFILDDKKLVEQVTIIRKLDILLTVHGAGVTNIAWLRPCSIVLEVFPYGYYIPNYFGTLAEKSGSIYFSWESSLKNTKQKLLLLERPHCQKIFDTLEKKVLDQNRDRNTTTVRIRYSDLCFEDDLCRSCSRGAEGVTVDIPYLQNILPHLLEKRIKCISEHDFI